MTEQPVTGDADLAERLARLDTCTLSDALDVLGMEASSPGWPRCGRALGSRGLR